MSDNRASMKVTRRDMVEAARLELEYSPDDRGQILSHGGMDALVVGRVVFRADEGHRKEGRWHASVNGGPIGGVIRSYSVAQKDAISGALGGRRRLIFDRWASEYLDEVEDMGDMDEAVDYTFEVQQACLREARGGDQ
jgi:hypothetical protein